MTNKKIFILVLICVFNHLNAQTKIFQYEQLVLNFYRDSILPKFPSTKKISLPKNAMDDTWYYDKGNCFEELLYVRKDSMKMADFEEYYPGKDIDNIGVITISKKDEKQFKFQKRKNFSKPCLRFSIPMIYNNSIYINIGENRGEKVFVYYFKMDKNGNILKWCRNELHIITN